MHGLCAELPGQGSRLNQGTSSIFSCSPVQGTAKGGSPQNTSPGAPFCHRARLPREELVDSMRFFINNFIGSIDYIPSLSLPPLVPPTAFFFLRVSREVPNPIRAHLPPNTLYQDAKKKSQDETRYP